MAQTILAVQERLNEIADKRMQIIEKSSLTVVKEIESYYAELGAKIQVDNDRYHLTKMPLLLETMQKFEKGSDAYEMYKGMIERDVDAQVQLLMIQFENVSRRQSQIIDGFLQAKERIIEQTGQITQGIIANMALGQGESVPVALEPSKRQVLLAGDGDKLLIEGGKVK